jgi:hypothetical protein
MRTLRSLLMLSVAIAFLTAAANRAPAAESYDSCVGDINTAPTVIATPGTWCLRQNVITNATNIRAVDIRTNNVTIDCNGFRLADAQAGPSTMSTGISANGSFSNITVRNCTIIGFNFGIFITAIRREPVTSSRTTFSGSTALLGFDWTARPASSATTP